MMGMSRFGCGWPLRVATTIRRSVSSFSWSVPFSSAARRSCVEGSCCSVSWSAISVNACELVDVDCESILARTAREQPLPTHFEFIIHIPPFDFRNVANMSAESLIASLRTAQDSTLSLILLTRLLPDLPPDSLPSLKDAIIRQLPQPATNKNVIAHLVAELVRLPTHAGWPQLEHFLASTPTSLLTLAICTEAPQLAPNDPTPLLVHGTPSLKFLVAYLKFIPLPALANYSNCFPVLFNSLPTYLQPLDTDSLNDSFTTLIDLFDSTQRTTLILKTTTLHSNLTSFLLALLSPPATASSTPRLEDDTYQLILELLCSVVEYSEALSFDDPNFLPSFINVLLNLMARTEGYAGIDSTGTNPLEAENEEKEWLDKSDFSSGNEEEDQAIGFIAESVLDRIALVIGQSLAPLPLAFADNPEQEERSSIR